MIRDNLVNGGNAPVTNVEGCLLLARGLMELLGARVEPYFVKLLPVFVKLANHSTSSAVRDASSDTATAFITILNPMGVNQTLESLLEIARESQEWKLKTLALEKITQLAKLHNFEVSAILPKVLPVLTPIVWDTKMQVSKAATTALSAVCASNQNPDIAPAIPEIVTAIGKPTTTMKAIEKLMHTTFIVGVDASTLSILCPILSRGLKEKMTLHKRMTSIVIDNMCKLVSTPSAVAPFGKLLVPELKKVCDNVQFEEIRDVAMKALITLTKALGHKTVESATEKYELEAKSVIEEERRKAEAEQKAIEDQRNAEEAARAEATRMDEIDRKKYKEAMEAERNLANLAEKKEVAAKAKIDNKREKDKVSVKQGGKCQGCGLKKCKKTCLFFSKE